MPYKNATPGHIMNIKTLSTVNQRELTGLFTTVFTSSEGEQEGKLIGNLASELASNIDNTDIICFGTYQNRSLIAAIFFTRLRITEPTSVYMLAPVAVSTQHQGKGIGQALITYGLNELKKRSVHVVITYGDPSFYSKAGFQSLSEDVIKPPLKLSMPEGWLAQSLTTGSIPVINEQPECVKEFNNPAYW